MKRGLLLALVAAGAHAAPEVVETISPHVRLVRAGVNGVLVERYGRVLAIYGDPSESPAEAERVLFTHHRRDVAWAGRDLVAGGAEAVGPLAEEALFSGVTAFWDRYHAARFHDYACQTSRVLTQPIPLTQAVRPGDELEWRGVTFQVLDGRGYTRGAVSYVFDLDGKRIACVGDLIYGDGQILDLYSLQDAIPEAKEDAYHGYAARAADVLASLRRVLASKPDLLIPSHGPLIRDPRAAVDRLAGRLAAVLASHFAVDALRWYRGDEKMRLQAGRVLPAAPEWMPAAEVRQELPPWLLPLGTSRLILSASGAAFLVDCGSRKTLEEVRRLRQQGRFRNLEGIWVTHYHDDHTDLVQAAAEEFRCPVYACREMRDILERPEAWRMPAQTATPVRNVVGTADGETRRWKEFSFTYSWFPGQTLFHGGLLVAKDGGESVFFAGDSFTPTGIDDYCLLNRNFFDPEKGFASCLRALAKLPPPTLLVNQHVAPAFRFSARQIELMLANLQRRARLLRDLLPWDDVNYGVDEQWARFYPYSAEVEAGRPVDLKLVILNHSPKERTFHVRAHVPKYWQGTIGWQSLSLKPRQQGSIGIRVVPARGAPGVVTADVATGGWDLREFAEALVTPR